VSRQGRPQTRTLENVKSFWEKEAAEWGDSPQVTIRDHYFRLLEIGATCELIEGRTHVLDIGCGSGFSTLFYAEHAADVVGADYSPTMVACARRFLTDSDYFASVMRRFSPNGWPRLSQSIRFEVGDVLDIDYPPEAFDAVIAQRVLINLPSRDLQAKAIAEIARVLEPAGLWISVEATAQGHREVDDMRALFGLPGIEKYWHNVYIDEEWLVEIAAESGLVIEEIRRFETYQFVTKVMHPLIAPSIELEFLSGFNDAARIASARYPTYRSVAAIGLARFLGEELKPLVRRLEPEKLRGYDEALEEILPLDPDFSRCSHQVMHVLRRSGHDVSPHVETTDGSFRG
jgi:SAM-dependent methyltransferase